MTVVHPFPRTRRYATRRARPAPVRGPTTRSSNATLLVATAAVLNLVGAGVVLGASSVASLTDYGSPWYFFARQLVWMVLGIVALAIGIRIEYPRWRRLVHPLLIGSGALLAVVLLPGVGI